MRQLLMLLYNLYGRISFNIVANVLYTQEALENLKKKKTTQEFPSVMWQMLQHIAYQQNQFA